jgi:hypothetical protein
MANYVATARSNYFKVKDAEGFKSWVSNCPNVALISRDDGTFAVYSDDPDSGSWPTFKWDEEIGDDVEFDLFEEIAEFLIDGEIAVFMEVGAEKLRYCNGYAIAVHSNGEYETLNLDRIYDFAEQRWGKRPTVAEY